ncbi:hypothetical protein [Planctomycetes bacterium K23_9]|uniref:hypothetical protein n=1 Tax=Stieleria marina TaxID=1930275 RepID=UPI0011A711B0
MKEKFVPVALDQADTRRQQDSEGDFYRQLAIQHSAFGLSTRNAKSAISRTTQGFYIATASGELLLYNNNRDPGKMLRLMNEKLREFASSQQDQAGASPVVLQSDRESESEDKVDQRYGFQSPKGGLVVRVQAKVLGGYPPTDDPWREIFQSALSRDNLWISAVEHKSIVQGKVPDSLLHRIARFHLVDNTRGEPLMWKPDEVKRIKMDLADGQFTGSALIHSSNNDRGYDAEIRGVIEVADGSVIRFDVVALGKCWGEGPYTRNPPPGKFPLAISFTLADGTDLADSLSPQGARGWLDAYLPK